MPVTFNQVIEAVNKKLTALAATPEGVVALQDDDLRMRFVAQYALEAVGLVINKRTGEVDNPAPAPSPVPVQQNTHWAGGKRRR